WEETDEATKAQQRIHFIKNLGLLGGLILAAVDTEGAPSLGWRARRRARRASYALQVGQSRAHGQAHQALAQAHQALAQAGDLLTQVSGSGAQAMKQAQQTAGALSTSGSKAAARAQQSARQARSSAGQNLKAQKAVLVGARKSAAQRGRAAAEPVLSTGVQKAGELWGSVAGHVHDLVPAG
ncbi:MAG TPA: hypothetical protein VLX59_13380, partial [Acidimicrobiales bacterium]|nr:hypothetical protein [Acidimicrobiales bacterium]